MTQEKIYLTVADLETQYGLKKSFQAKYRTVTHYPIPYTRPAGSRVVLYRKDKIEAWLEKFNINDVA